MLVRVLVHHVYPCRYDLVKALAQHMVDRHGLSEVSSWKWEVWNEMWGMDYPRESELCTCAMYRATVALACGCPP